MNAALSFLKEHSLTETQAAETWDDFEKMPLQKAADLLRALGDQLIRSLLQNTSTLVWPKTWDRKVPDIWKTQQMWRSGWRHEFLDALPFGKSLSRFFERRYIRRIMAGKVTWEAYRKRFKMGMHAELGTGTEFGLTPEMWCLAGEAAWIGPDFQLPINRSLDQRLRSEVLLDGGRPVKVFISPQAVWALIALAAAQPQSRKQRRAMDPLLRRLRKPLGRIAADQAMRAAWAGFWDQWLLIRALPLVHRRFPLADSPLLKALKELPLREAVGSKALPKVPIPPRFLIKRLWWLARFWSFALITEIRHFGKKHRHVPEGLADPEWQDHLPVWAKHHDLIARNF